MEGIVKLTIKPVEKVSVYCVCEMPESPNTKCYPIACSGRKKWPHTEMYLLGTPHGVVAHVKNVM